MDSGMSAKLMADFDAEQICYLPRTWCKACAEATRNNRAPSACDKGRGHEVKPCPRCRTRITTAHVDLDYVGHADVRARLCQADPEWTWAPYADMPGGPLIIQDGHPVGFWILLTVGGVTKPGYGSCEKGKSEAVKELIGDALRNAALSFGVAWKLWAKGDRSDQEGQQAASHADEPASRNGRTRTKIPDAEYERTRHSLVGRQPEDRPADRGPIPPGDDMWAGQPAGPPLTLPPPSNEPGSADGKQIRDISVQLNTLGITDHEEQLARIERIINGPLDGPETADDGTHRTRKNLSKAEAIKVKAVLAEDIKAMKLAERAKAEQDAASEVDAP